MMEFGRMDASRMKTLRLAAVSSISAVFLAIQPVGSEVLKWTVGGDQGVAWRAQELRSTAMNFDVPGAIQLVAFTSEDNVISSLNWVDGFPPGYVPERAEARIWDNIAVVRPLLEIVDGIDTTSTNLAFKRFGIAQDGTKFFFDLGTRFPANRIAFFPRLEGLSSEGRPFSEDYIRGYVLKVNDGSSFNEQNEPIYTPLSRVDFTRENMTQVDFPLQFVRYIELEITSASPFELAEFQLFGSGFAPAGSYRSQVIDLGEPANFSRVKWTVEKLRQVGNDLVVEPAAAAEIRVVMRTGLDDNPRVYYEYINLFTRERQVVTEDEYYGLDEGVRGPIDDDQVNWSLWSAPFTESGQQIQLPSPRRYFQFEVEMKSDAILDGLRLSSLSVEHTIPPVAQLLVAEISQLDDPRPVGDVPIVPAGDFTTFAYDVIAEIQDADTGFDALRILTPRSTPVFRQFFMGDDAVEVKPDSAKMELGSLTIFFPSHRPGTGIHRMRAVLDAQIFVQGTFVEAEVFDSQSGEVPQRVQPGDANPEVLTNALRVLTTATSAGNLVSSLAVSHPVFTPNGDGINDQVELNYSLLQLVKPVGVEVGIYDLAGRRVRTVLDAESTSGAYAVAWDGRDDQRQVVPPGLYLVVVQVHTERETFVRTGSMGVAY
jgi:hypothetical protein